MYVCERVLSSRLAAGGWRATWCQRVKDRTFRSRADPEGQILFCYLHLAAARELTDS